MNTKQDSTDSWRKPAPQKNKRVVILLDRSGSMDEVKLETIKGFNGYLDGITDDRAKVSVVQFDSQGIDSLCDGKSAKEAVRLDGSTYKPRGSTPLYDAIGKTIQRIRDEAKDDDVLFVTLTDGKENTSTEYNKASAQKLIKEQEGKGWTFAYIGMGVEGWEAVQDIAYDTRGISNVARQSKDAGGIICGYNKLHNATATYCASAGGQSLNLSDQMADEEHSQ